MHNRWNANMKKLLTILFSLLTLVMVSMVFALPLYYAHNQQSTLSLENSQLADTARIEEQSGDVTRGPDSATAIMLLLGTGLVGLAGINRKKG